MTDGQQHDERQDPGEEFRPRPGQPTLPFRAYTPPPAADSVRPPAADRAADDPDDPDGPRQPGHGYPQQAAEGRPAGPGPQPGHGYPRQPGYGYPRQAAGRPGQPGPPDPRPDNGSPRQPAQPGYGSPRQPAQPGYGYPQDPPGAAGATPPGWAPPAAPLGDGAARPPAPTTEPDWSALAASSERDAKRRKALLIGGGALAAVLVAGIVATAVMVTGRHAGPGPHPTATRTGTEPSPTFSDVTPTAPPDPLAVLSSATKDSAPLTTAGLFPGRTLNYGASRHYTKATTDASTSCSAATSAGLAAVVDREGCHRVLRASYYGDGIAVTVGVAVFDTKADADRVKARTGFDDYVLPLSGAGLGPFCHATTCQTAVNAVGRYAYFTIAGRTDGGRVSQSDPATSRAAADVSDFAFDSLVRRGRQEAAGATPSG